MSKKQVKAPAVKPPVKRTVIPKPIYTSPHDAIVKAADAVIARTYAEYVALLDKHLQGEAVDAEHLGALAMTLNKSAKDIRTDISMYDEYLRYKRDIQDCTQSEQSIMDALDKVDEKLKRLRMEFRNKLSEVEDGWRRSGRMPTDKEQKASDALICKYQEKDAAMQAERKPLVESLARVRRLARFRGRNDLRTRLHIEV
jgi:hypothetical protein